MGAGDRDVDPIGGVVEAMHDEATGRVAGGPVHEVAGGCVVHRDRGSRGVELMFLRCRSHHARQHGLDREVGVDPDRRCPGSDRDGRSGTRGEGVPVVPRGVPGGREEEVIGARREDIEPVGAGSVAGGLRYDRTAQRREGFHGDTSKVSRRPADCAGHRADRRRERLVDRGHRGRRDGHVRRRRPGCRRMPPVSVGEADPIGPRR